MKRIFFTAILMLFTFLPPAHSSATSADIIVLMDNVPLMSSVAPVIEQGHTLVPMRAIFEQLGAEVVWVSKQETLYVSKGDLKFSYHLGDKFAETDEALIQLDYPGKIIKGSVMMPTRFVAEIFGAQVKWDKMTRTVSIQSPPKVQAVVTRVLDGLYIELQYRNLKGDTVVEPVGLAGLSPVRNGMEATEYIRALLPVGTSVELDIRGGRDSSKQLWAAIYMANGNLLNRQLVVDGYAKNSLNRKDAKLQESFIALQNEAQTLRKGAWGDTEPFITQPITSVSVASQVAVVTAEGQLWVWGQFYEKPTKLLDNVVQAKVENNSGIALKQDGTVWVWGLDQAGAWGNGADDYQATVIPRQVEGLQHIVSIERNQYATMVIDNSGTVYAWGSNYNGRLGKVYSSGLTFPTPFSLEWKDVQEVKIGFFFTVILKKDGTVWITQPYSPDLVQMKELTDIKAIATDNTAVLALKQDGTVWGWGVMNNGIFGNGKLFTETPAPIKGLKNIVEVVSGFSHFFAIDAEGSLYGWGENYSGELGMVTSGGRVKEPVLITTVSPVSHVYAGSGKSLFLKQDGTLWAVGYSPDHIFGEDSFTSTDDGLDYHKLVEINKAVFLQ